MGVAENLQNASSIPCSCSNGGSVQVLNAKIITVPKLTRSASSSTSFGIHAHKLIAAPGSSAELVCSRGQLKMCPLSLPLFLWGKRRAVCETLIGCGDCFLVGVDPRTGLNKFQQEFLLFSHFYGSIHLKKSLCPKEQKL